MSLKELLTGRFISKGKLSLVVIVFFLQGCASTVQIDEKGRSVIHNFGYVKIVLPPKYSSLDRHGKPLEFTSTGINTFGVQGGENGFSIGYSATSLLKVPLDCRFVAIVNDEAQLKHLIDTLEHLKGEQLCVTVSSD
ncbi:hypothetical protein [Endothiovibrio diazotrophicus]